MRPQTSKKESAGNAECPIGGTRQATGMAEWTEGAERGQWSSVRAPSGGIGENPGKAVKGIPDSLLNGREFEAIVTGRSGLFRGKMDIRLRSLSSGFNIFY
jgi:hypothetical protein